MHITSFTLWQPWFAAYFPIVHLIRTARCTHSLAIRFIRSILLIASFVISWIFI